MRRIAVTGAGGYIGRRLTAELVARGFEVRALLLPNDLFGARALAKIQATVAYGDVTQRSSLSELLAGADTVLHLAGSHRLSPEPLHRLLVNGTRNVVEEAIANGLHTVVACSSAAVYERRCDDLLGEDAPKTTTDRYGLLTLEMESAILDEISAAAISATVLRIAEVYGPGTRGMLIGECGPADTGFDGRNWRSFVHVDDVVTAMLAVARLRLRGAYNLGDLHPMRASDAYAIIGQHRTQPRPGLARPVRRTGDPHEAIVMLQARSTRLDARRLWAAIDDRPRFESLREGLRALTSGAGCAVSGTGD